MKSAKRTTNKLENIKDMEKGFTLTEAMNEAARCLLCYDAPCSKGCPAGTDPGAFIKKLRFRNIKGAMATVKENNIFGGTCGIVCPVSELCEKECSATGIGSPIEIGKIQRFLVEHSWDTGFNPIEKQKRKNIKVAVIGSGPGGLSCAAELAKKGIDVTVFEKKDKSGGMLRYGVPEFRLNSEFLERELEDIKRLGVKIKCRSKVKDADKLLKQGFKAVFIATGLWKPIKLNIPGSDLENIMTSTEFLEQARDKEGVKKIRKMVKKKNVALMGGGDVAMDVACTCKGLGAKKVYVIYRRSLREAPAERDELIMAMDNYVAFHPQTTVTEFIGRNGKVVGLKGLETDWVKPNDYTSKNLKTVPGTEFNLKIDAFVFAIGTKPENDVKDISSRIKFDKGGYIKTRKDGVSTNDKKIYAGGDIVRGSALVVQAVSDGKEAARKIADELGIK